MDFEEALSRLGFSRSSERSPRGVRTFTAQPDPYLTYTVQAFEDGTALFTWEFAVGEYLLTKGIQFGSDETLNQFAYPVSYTHLRAHETKANLVCRLLLEKKKKKKK